MSDVASSAILKIQRAKHHIDDLNRQVEAFLTQRPFKLVHRQNPETVEETLAIKTEKRIPPEISLVVVDTIHNLRCALDHIVFAIVSPLVDPAQHRSIQFPFTSKAEAFVATLASTKVKLAPEKVREAITALEPYPRGRGERLFNLHSLDIMDRHHLIATAKRTAEFEAKDIQRIWPHGNAPFGGEGWISFATQDETIVKFPLIFQNRRAKRRWQAQAFGEKETKFQPPFEIKIAVGTDFQTAIPWLVAVTRDVETVIGNILAAL